MSGADTAPAAVVFGCAGLATIATVLGSDSIVVLDQGKLVDSGTHEQLLERCPTYRQIASSQLTHSETPQTQGQSA